MKKILLSSMILIMLSGCGTNVISPPIKIIPKADIKTVVKADEVTVSDSKGIDVSPDNNTIKDNTLVRIIKPVRQCPGTTKITVVNTSTKTVTITEINRRDSAWFPVGMAGLILLAIATLGSWAYIILFILVAFVIIILRKRR